MTIAYTFDVLIIYSGLVADSANSLSEDVVAPFAEGSAYESYNVVYGYFLQVCQKNGLKAAFSTSADITGAGECQSYWLFRKNRWIKVKEPCFSSLIFDKFSPKTKTIKTCRDLCFSSPKVKPFNPPALYQLFFDKQKAYDRLSAYSIPTVTIKNGSNLSINLAFKNLKKIEQKHLGAADFSQEIVIKDRFGAGGRLINKFKSSEIKKISQFMKKNKHISFIAQPFINFDQGYLFNNCLVPADIRLIYLGGKIIQTYIRVAKKGDFRCNEHQGGKLKYLPKKEIPAGVVAYSDKIAAILNHKSSLFTLDFVISNQGNIYLLEGNTNPGLDWNLTLKENELEAHRLIKLIVKELVNRVKTRPSSVSDFFPEEQIQPALV